MKTIRIVDEFLVSGFFMLLPFPQAIFFDLDGTLADTAPDLAAAVNQVRTARRLEPVSYDQLRPVASAGARGLIGAAFGISPEDSRYAELRDEFLDYYSAAISEQTILFDSVPDLLKGLLDQKIPWGIVTNKAARFTEALIPRIGLSEAQCVISGDTTPYPKPHPEPLLEAARRLVVDPRQCWYVGDDVRDIEAGRAAGMQTIAAAWGYCGNSEPIAWRADAIARQPLEIARFLAER